MEEAKISKPSSIIATFKHLKKPYQIAIIIALVAVILILVKNLIPVSTPFDKISDTMTKEDAHKVFGPLTKESFGEYNVPYQWAGIDGTLELDFWWKPGALAQDNSASTVCDYAGWHARVSNPSSYMGKLSRILSRNYTKKSENTWIDKDGNTISMGESGSEIWVVYRAKWAN